MVAQAGPAKTADGETYASIAADCRSLSIGGGRGRSGDCKSIDIVLPFFGREMYCPSEAFFLWPARMRRFWRRIFDLDATGRRRLRVKARLPVLRLRDGWAPRL